MTKSIGIFSLIYLVPQLVNYWAKVLPGDAVYFPIKFSLLIFVLILLTASNKILKINKGRSIYWVPLTIVLFSFLFYILLISVLNLSFLGYTKFLGDVPSMITDVILNTIWSLLPIVISMVYIYYVRNSKAYLRDKSL